MSFDEFISKHEEKLRAALVAAYGPEVGVEVTADALAYAWQDWDRLATMANPVGYLYRVGQSSSRRYLRAEGYLPARPAAGLPEFEPALAPALESLSESQRVAVVMVHGLGWRLTETADLLGVDVSTLRTHLARGMIKLRTALRVEANVS